ncbi:MAG: septum formation initiator family protein [Draconibacterium sp.]
MEVEKLKSGAMKVLRNKYLVAIILFFAWVVFFDENSIVYHQKNRHRLNEMNEQKVYYREKIQEDRQKLEDLNSGARDLEKFAREQYFMSKPDEDIFIVVEKD